jgi:hypothetical protein
MIANRMTIKTHRQELLDFTIEKGCFNAITLAQKKTEVDLMDNVSIVITTLILSTSS